jgi:phosphate transport system permease protein
LFVGIPSVVYGWIGLSVLVPLIRNHLGGFGFSILSGGIVLSLMILPTITSVACDALKAVPNSYREAAYSLGATRWQVISKVFVPAAGPGILTGVVLAMGRAFGETLAVQMVIGNVPIIPKSLLDPGITLTTGITMDMVNTVNGSLWNSALWSMALVLLILSLFFMSIVKLIAKRSKL